eukprot:298441_1
MVHTSSSTRTIIGFTEALLCFIAAPYAVYHYIKFNKLSHSIMVQKRHPKILKLTGIWIIYCFVLGMPLMAIAWSRSDIFKGDLQTILDVANNLFYSWGTCGVFICTAWRFWHVYFDLKHSSSQKNSEWKYHLDPSLVKHNFWLTHK